ncbi:hypothetical protein AWZ03_012629 [Drosophila navojoa]|uniref:Uncharacterized protein n=1 Tax=Drosophila navojoa TaxID=7232 RepID=A0A484AWT6_DRONA|nr:hypothetical protein AWZ03_012629 [Drosophila navojoa]
MAGWVGGWLTPATPLLNKPRREPSQPVPDRQLSYFHGNVYGSVNSAAAAAAQLQLHRCQASGPGEQHAAGRRPDAAAGGERRRGTERAQRRGARPEDGRGNIFRLWRCIAPTHWTSSSSASGADLNAST